jgi:hypothetical protein
VVDERGGVDEGEPGHVRGRILEHDRDLDDDLLTGRDVDAEGGIFDHQIRSRPGVDGSPGLRTADLGDSDKAQIGGRNAEVVRDPDVVDREGVGRLRDGDPVAERLAHRRRRLGVLLEQRGQRRPRDHDLRRVLVSCHVGIGLTVDVGVVAIGELDRAEEVCLVEDHAAVSERRVQPDVELDPDLAARGNAQAADVEDAGPVRSAARVGVAGVGAWRDAAGDERERAGHERGKGVEGAQIVMEREVVERDVRALQAQRVAQRVARSCRRSRAHAAGEVLDALLEEVAGQRHRDGVSVLVIGYADAAVAQGARVGLAIGIAAVGIEPLRRSSDIGERDAVLAVSVELGPVGDDQALIRTDRARSREQGQGQLAAGRRAVAEREVAALDQHAGDRRAPVGLEDLGAQHLGRRVAHAARGAVGEPVEDRDVPGVTEPGIVDIEAELPPLAQVQRQPQRRRARLRDHELGRADRERRRDPPLAREGLVEHAIDESPELPLGGVDELRACHVRGRVREHHRDLDFDLLSGRDDGKAVEGEQTVHVRECVRHGSAAALPVGDMAQIGEIYSRRVEVVRDDDAVQVVERTTCVDDAARRRVEQDRDREAVGEGHSDGGRGLARGVALVDLLDGDQKVLAALLDRGRGAVGEPDPVPGNGVARHLTGVHDVVEDDEPSFVGLAGLCQEAEIGGQRVGGWKVPDRAVPVDLELGGSDGARRTVEHAAGIVGAILRLRRGDPAQQEQEGEQQEPAPAAA